jgi:hypothetical protein
VRGFRQENWSVDETKELTISSDGSYLFVDISVAGRYVERGVVDVDGTAITFHAAGATDPVLGLDLGATGRWQVAKDEIGEAILLLQIPGHRNFDGASNTADLYYFN